MKYLSSVEIRKLWCDFFAKHDHLILPSKSLVPVNDPSLLLINSGVATLKDYFSNKKTPPYKNLVNSQKCIRTNDIENVGVTARHLTFFEMLGNFSIGGYFKKQAIQLAYEFLFKVLKFEKAKIYITYHQDDKVTYNEWLKHGIDASHLIKGNDKTNFWDVGKGPCGYDTEIFYDRGLDFDPEKKGLELLEKDYENDRYLEIWNIVFSEFNNNGQNHYQELQLKNIDTGAGLERIVAIFQNGITNFDTDLFLPIIKATEQMSLFKYDGTKKFAPHSKQNHINKYFKIIADHMRSITMAIQDGVTPSNTLRGYVIRKLIRRAYWSGIKLQIKNRTFLNKLVTVVSQTLPVYPVEIEKVTKIINQEQLLFAKTIKQGEEIILKQLKNNQHIDSKTAFKLYETYGYPLDLTIEIAKEYNVKVDLSQFDQLKKTHVKISQKSVNHGLDTQLQTIQQITSKVSQFVGYDTLMVNSDLLFSSIENDNYYSLFKETPFYATSGGQKHDIGLINQIPIIDVFKDKYGNHWHISKQKINSKSGFHLEVDKEMRLKSARNHSATHLLGSALNKILGFSTQLGSENNPQKLRIDFPAKTRPTDKQISEIENEVNNYIKQKIDREYLITTKKNALEMGAWILEKDINELDDKKLVRVVKFNKVSLELCGGTHVENTSEIEKFKIIKLESKGSGNYRIEAITSYQTIAEYEKNELVKYQEILTNLIKKNQSLKHDYHLTLTNDLEVTKNQIENAQKDYKKLLTEKQSNINLENIKIKWIIFEKMQTYINLEIEENIDIKKLASKLRDKYPQNLIILGTFKQNKYQIVVASKTYNSNQILQSLIEKYDGKGGGSKILAMGLINQKIKF